MHGPVRITIYGLFPTLYSMCAPCCTRDYLAVCRPGYVEEQMGEYPEPMLRNQRLLEAIVRIAELRGLRARIEVVGVDSIRGVVLSARYRLGTGPAVIVEGKVFRGRELDPEVIVDYACNVAGRRCVHV